MSEALSTADPKTLNRAQAQQAFDELVKQIPAQDGSRDFVAAWSKAKLLRPDLVERMTMPGAALENENCFAQNAIYMAMLGLPTSISADEFACAWRANGNAPAPVNSNAMFDALTGFTMAKQNLSTLDEARKATAQKFPLLARQAGYTTEAA